jgi:hypothetical protein
MRLTETSIMANLTPTQFAATHLNHQENRTVISAKTFRSDKPQQLTPPDDDQVDSVLAISIPLSTPDDMAHMAHDEFQSASHTNDIQVDTSSGRKSIPHPRSQSTFPAIKS